MMRSLPSSGGAAFRNKLKERTNRTVRNGFFMLELGQDGADAGGLEVFFLGEAGELVEAHVPLAKLLDHPILIDRIRAGVLLVGGVLFALRIGRMQADAGLDLRDHAVELVEGL